MIVQPAFPLLEVLPVGHVVPTVSKGQNALILLHPGADQVVHPPPILSIRAGITTVENLERAPVFRRGHEMVLTRHLAITDHDEAIGRGGAETFQ